MSSKAVAFAKVLGRILDREDFIGRAGKITRKPVNPSAVGQSVISTPRHVENEAFEHGRGKKYPDPTDPKEPPDSNPFYRPNLYTDVKKCSQCKRFRRPSEFSPQRRRGKVYLQSICKFCKAENIYRIRHGLIEGRSAP